MFSNIVNMNMIKYVSQKCQKYQIVAIRSVRSSSINAPKVQNRSRHPAGGAYDAPRKLLVGCGGGHPSQ